MARIRRPLTILAMAGVMLVMFALGWVVAKSGVGGGVDPASLTDLERRFTERMTKVALVGRFTVAGREDRLGNPERYEIANVTKVGDDHWRFDARVMYGSVDVTLPMTVTMIWAGDTPMISLTDFTIPTLGTFTTRIFFYEDRYAGSWQHGDVGGHMFGTIETIE